jgi:hypothetical protein
MRARTATAAAATAADRVMVKRAAFMSSASAGSLDSR